MPIESAPIVFAATDLEFGCLCYLSLDWAGLLTSDATMTLLDAWAWSEIATISEKGGGGFFHARCTVKLEMVGGRRKNVRLKDAADLRRFFHTVARFTPTEKVGGRRRTLWRQRRALRLLHTPNPNSSQGLPNGNGTLPPSSAALARLSPDRAALEVPSSSRGSNSNRSTHQRWPIVEEEEEEENGEVNPGTSSSFIVRLPRAASRVPSYATLLRKQKQNQNQEEEEEEEEKLKSSSSSSEGEGISERGKRLSLSTRSVVSTETQTVYPPPPPPPPPPPSLFQTPSYRRPPPLLLKKKGVIVSAQKLAVAVAAPCLLQASLLDELKSNFRSGIFIPPVRPKLPPAIIAAATLARKGATLKRVASTASLPLLSPLSRSISEASKSSSSASSSSFSSTKSVKGGDDDDEDDEEAEEEAEDGADDYESQNTGGGNHPLTLFEELQNFIRFGRLRHVEPRVKQVATTTATLFNEDSFRNFRYPLFQRMVSAPALLPSPYFPARAPARPAAFQVRNARLQEEEKDDEGGSDNSTQLENHHQQEEEEEEEKEKKEDIHENNPSPPKQKTFILRPQKTPPPPPPQIIQYHPFPEKSEVKNVDPDGNNNNNGNNNGNAQFRACQLTPVPCAEHGTDLVVQQEHQHQQEQQEQHQDQDLITPEKTPFGLITGQPCRRRALSFASDDHQADGGEEEEDNNSSKSENDISSSKEPPLLAPLDRQEN